MSAESISVDAFNEKIKIILKGLEIAKSALERFKWISVEERLPKEYERVLISCDEGVCAGKLFFDQWQCDPIGSYAGDGCVFNVTHWMELPEGPK